MAKKIIVSDPPPFLREIIMESDQERVITFFLLGDREKGWVPPRKYVEAFRRKLARALKSKEDTIVIHDNFLRVIQVKVSKGKICVMDEHKVEIVE